MSENIGALTERRLLELSAVVSLWGVVTVALSRVWNSPKPPAPASVKPKLRQRKVATSNAEVRYFKKICLKIQ
jgi:hypothetical protein